MMNDVSHLFAGSEMIIFAASVLLQATLIIVLALLLGRWLWHQPALRHSVLLGGLMCVLFCPVATHIADRIEVPLISIAWPTTPALHSDVPALATARESAVVLSHESVVSPSEAPITLASLSPSDTTGQTERSPDMPESGSSFEPPVPEEVTRVSAAESARALPDITPNVLSGTEIAHGPSWMNVANIAGLIWFIGMVVISIRLLLAWRYLNRLQANAVPLDEQGLPQLRLVREDVLRVVGAKRLPPLLVSDQLNGPVSIGLSRPAIVLPREMTQTLNASQLRDILIHETAHIHRRDHVVVLLQRLAGAIFWPFPLLWRLNAKIDEAREDVCDNYVLSHTEASQYSRMLLELTERAATPQAIPLAIGLWKCPRKLEQRVVALLDPRRTTRTRLPRRTLCTLTVAFMAIAVLLAGSRITPTNDAVAAKPQQPTDEVAKQPTKLEKKKDVTPAAKPVAPAAKPVAVESKDQADPYDKLYDVIMTRYGNDGKGYGRDETSPLIFSWSKFSFDDRTFDKFDPALKAFAALPQKDIDEYSDVKRALLQRHLWKVFDTTFNWDWGPDWWWSGRKSFPKTHLDRRAAVQRPIVSLLRKLALTKAEILSLPNPMAATLKGGGFAQTHDPADRFKPFLPTDLYAKESTWICLGENKTPIPASQHTSKSYSRSMFLQFVRLPGGRDETLEYLERIKKRPHQFPVGTQFALLEQPFLISKEGELVLSPMIASIQLRAYLNVGRRFSSSEDAPQVTQCVAEFVMQPRELMKGNAIMKAMGPNDFRFDGGAPDSVGSNPRDPFEAGENGGRMPSTSRLNQCMSCHGSAGGRGVRTRSFAVTNSFHETSAAEVSKATSAQKLESDDWKALRALWQGKSLPKDDDARMAEPKKKPEQELEKFPDTPKLRETLVSRIETEVADELKKLHTAILLAETAKLSEMFQLDEVESNKLRVAAESAVEKTRNSLKTTVNKSSGYILNKKDVDKSAFRINDRFVQFAPKPNTRDSVKKTKEQNGSYIDAETGRWVDTTLNVEVERRAANVAISIGLQGSFVNRIGPHDTDVQKEEVWNGALSAVLTEEQLAQYKQHLQNRSKSTVVDMLLTALQFDLDLQESQLPAVRKRVEERVNADPSKNSSFISGDVERTVAGYLQRLKAEDLSDILTNEQLDQFPERSQTSIKSTIITLILRELQFDLHLPDSQLPIVRKQLEERINPGELNYSIESAAMRTRWQMKGDVVADVLTGPQRTLWRFTQEQH